MIQPIKLCARCGHGFISFDETPRLFCETCQVAIHINHMAIQRARLRYLAIAGLTLIGGILWLIFR